jgi:hypothetical protein
VLDASIIITLMMEAASNTEKSANFYKIAPSNNPEDSHLKKSCWLLT